MTDIVVTLVLEGPLPEEARVIVVPEGWEPFIRALMQAEADGELPPDLAAAWKDISYSGVKLSSAASIDTFHYSGTLQ